MNTFDQDYDYSQNDVHLSQQNNEVPHSSEAEQALLGALIWKNLEVYPEVRDLVQPKHFYNPIHVKLMEVIYSRSRRGATADAIYLKNRFSQYEQLQEIGGVEYIALLLDCAPPLAAAPEYARLVTDTAGKRQCIRFAQDILKNARDPLSESSSVDLIEAARKDLSAIEGVLPSDATFITLRQAAVNSVSVIGVERPMGLPTGFSDLDYKLAGLGRGKLSVVAARPSMGKTSLATNIARQVAKGIPGEDGNNIPGKIGYFSQEMPASELGERAASTAAGKVFGVPYIDIAKHKVGPKKKETLLERSKQNIPETILVCEGSELTVSEISKRARAMEKQLGGLDMIIIDYLNLC